MKYAWIVILSFASMLSLIKAPSQAGCTVVRTNAYISKPAVITKKVIVEEVPVFTRFYAVALLADLPTYSAVYVPPVAVPTVPPVGVPTQPAAQPQQSGTSEMQQILQALRAMDARLQKLETGKQPLTAPQPQTQPQPPARMDRPSDGPPGVSGGPLQAKCAICHDDSKAAKDGGSFVMFRNGLRVNFTDAQKTKIARKMRRGEMPPESSKIPPITDEEYVKIADELGF